jgi:hypothetical protein
MRQRNISLENFHNYYNLSSQGVSLESLHVATEEEKGGFFKAIGASGDVVSLFGANSVDSPQKNKITIPARPAFRGESASSSICCKSITTNNYGFRILMIKCID